MKKVLLFSALSLLLGKAAFSQNDGDYRNRLNNSGFGSATTWEVYSSATGAWTTAATVPDATTNVVIRDGSTQTSNVSGQSVKSLTIGEGNGAIATATLTGDAVTAINIVNPGQLAFIPGVVFIGPATTLATATVASVNVTGVSINNPGAGYTTATVTFADAPAGGTTATGTPIISAGKITGVTITNPGSGYTSIPAITVSGDGTGAVITSKVGIQSINITNGGAGYTTPPTVVLGTAFLVGNATTARTFTVVDSLTFKRGAQLISGGGSSSITQTLNVGGNLSAETPISFITQVPTSTAQTTINFTKAGTQLVSG
jgi:hypothetical protein